MAVVGIAEGVGGDRRRAIRTHSPTVLTDLYLDDGSGVDAGPPAVAPWRPPRSCVLTVSRDPDEMLAAVRAGADGYLTKDQAPERLVRALKGVLATARRRSRGRWPAHLVRDVRDVAAPDAPGLDGSRTASA